MRIPDMICPFCWTKQPYKLSMNPVQYLSISVKCKGCRKDYFPKWKAGKWESAVSRMVAGLVYLIEKRRERDRLAASRRKQERRKERMRPGLAQREAAKDQAELASQMWRKEVLRLQAQKPVAKAQPPVVEVEAHPPCEWEFLSLSEMSHHSRIETDSEIGGERRFRSIFGAMMRLQLDYFGNARIAGAF